ncbi:LEUCINE-RICH REPEAT RECEPTOR-LIKE PROTEIN KINASE [Salix koriyanagi]|uniref:LEUCINE-RICH REPEAT RECEPTOR-LIKE PROTEIN KINASE n=1 Tax=Salix koriyanagi TaxID=2511006 RepID=A0A9Q0VCS3_9ROSI|nr:LEUCINE-RICH REPEAT RECEPTOR-LIKE PROTEIN KINASE [Salix koriyanagi]
MEIFHCLYFGVLLTLTFIVAVVVATDPYSVALLSLKSELSLDDWSVPPGGNTGEKVQACSWSGVKCNKNSTVVISLDLSTKNLGGELSGERFSVFTELVDLNFGYNSFSGQLLVGIFNLTNLKVFDISETIFSDPVSGGNLRSSKLRLYLMPSSNGFYGRLPVEIPQLEHLKILNMAGSYFDGPIPSRVWFFQEP